MDTVRDTGSPARQADVGAAAYQALRALVTDGRLPAGAPLIEADLSKRLRVSRTPVRAALQRLRQEGFVAPSPVGQASRPIVAPLTAADLAEVFLMAGALEACAARTAAGLDSTARQALVARLARAVVGLEKAAAVWPADLAGVLGSHRLFHHLIVEAGPGPRLRAEFDLLAIQVERYARVYLPATLGRTTEAIVELQIITEAIRAGDAEEAERRVASHWSRSADGFRRVVAIVGELGTW